MGVKRGAKRGGDVRASTLARVRGVLAAADYAGLGVGVAAQRAGVHPKTFRRVATVDEVARGREVASRMSLQADERAMVIQVLLEQARAGSVPAAKLLLEETRHVWRHAQHLAEPSDEALVVPELADVPDALLVLLRKLAGGAGGGGRGELDLPCAAAVSGGFHP